MNAKLKAIVCSMLISASLLLAACQPASTSVVSSSTTSTSATSAQTTDTLAYTSATGPLFYITNATGKITLNGVDVPAASGVLVQAAANDRWGTSGANGGNAVLVANGQMLSGNAVADKISTLALTLQSNSTLTGTINADHTAKSASLALDASSTWNVTADSYLTTLSDAAGISGTSVANIVGNGHTVYYDSAANPDLNGQTFTLTNGGTLKPVG